MRFFIDKLPFFLRSNHGKNWEIKKVSLRKKNISSQKAFYVEKHNEYFSKNISLSLLYLPLGIKAVTK